MNANHSHYYGTMAFCASRESHRDIAYKAEPTSRQLYWTLDFSHCKFFKIYLKR